MTGGFIASLIPKTIGTLLDRYNNQQLVIKGMILLAVLYILNEGAVVFRRLIVERISTNFSKQLTKDAAKKILHLDIDFLHGQRSGGLNAKVQNSVNGSVKLVKLFFMDLIPSFFIMLFAIGFALSQSAFIGTVLLIILPVNAWLIMRQLKSQRGVRIGLIRAQEDINGMMIEMISGLEEIRVANVENKQLAMVEQSAGEICAKEYQHHKGMVKFDFTKGMLKWAFHIVILSISIFMAYRGDISIGNVLTYSMLYMASIKPIEEIHRYLDELHENSIKALDLKNILEEYPEDISFATGDDLANDHVPHVNAVVVNDLSFQYQGQKRNGEQVLNHISLTIANGSYVGIVGSTGCGKSSLIKNLLRLQTGQGEITLNGNPINRLSRKKIAEQVIYIPQSPYIFNGTIRDNIAFGSKRTDVPEQEIWDAIDKASLLDYVKTLDQGLDTVITERGNNLSGGQKQRISLARVFINSNKPIIILDEATSALDNATEAKIYYNLRSTGRTLISIAHRLNTLLSADKILVIDKGQVVETGNFATLSQQEGLFSQLSSCSASLVD